VCGFVLRWNPSVLAARALIGEGLLGEILYVQADYWHNPEQSGYPGSEHHLRRMDASAMLLGGCHAVDLARYLMGSDVVEASAQQTAGAPGLPFPPMQAAVVRFANGRIGKVSACVEQWMPYQFNVDLLGTEGGLRDNRFYSRKLPGVTGWATFPTVLPDSGAVGHHPFQGEIDHFLDCVRDGRREPRQPARRGQHPRGLLRHRPLRGRGRGAGAAAPWRSSRRPPPGTVRSAPGLVGAERRTQRGVHGDAGAHRGVAARLGPADAR
jgi:predicted dehydrogenase